MFLDHPSMIATTAQTEPAEEQDYVSRAWPGKAGEGTTLVEHVY